MANYTARGVNLGPLTTTWAAADPNCTLPIVGERMDTYHDANLGTLGGRCTLFSGPTYCPAYVTSDATTTYTTRYCTTDLSYWYAGNNACWPTAPAITSHGYYSPGLICPSGWTDVYRETAGSYSSFRPYYALSENETAMGCCPSSYTATDWSDSQWCFKTYTEASLSALYCFNTMTQSISTLPWTWSSAQYTTTYDVLVLSAPLLQLNYRASDLSNALPSSTSAPLSVATGTYSPSVGTKAGVGAGAGIGGLALLSGAVFFIRRYRQRRGAGVAQEANTQVGL
ncbi:hypothetical protein GGR57DRAFT_95525 [Xylariaceae sp. FL1272]|nr:hypothetical protein GGR57DRAFT_95525 [Xylariaceae sp. FL1272]